MAEECSGGPEEAVMEQRDSERAVKIMQSGGIYTQNGETLDFGETQRECMKCTEMHMRWDRGTHRNCTSQKGVERSDKHGACDAILRSSGVAMGRKCDRGKCDGQKVRWCNMRLEQCAMRELATGGFAISDRIANIYDAIKSHCKYLRWIDQT